MMDKYGGALDTGYKILAICEPQMPECDDVTARSTDMDF